MSLSQRAVSVVPEAVLPKKPTDVLLIGDSMIKRLQVDNQPVRVWKFSYPGGTAQELHDHFPSEKLPGEALVGVVFTNIGTNDLSRSRDRVRTVAEVLQYLQFFLKRLLKMYPQSKVVFCSILPRLDLDDERVVAVNQKMAAFTRTFSRQLEFQDFSRVFRGQNRNAIREYYRDTEEDVVHLSSSGTQVQQDVFNRYFNGVSELVAGNLVDLSKLMWQSEWEYFNMWNIKTSSVRENPYLTRKRITNFTEAHYREVKRLEKLQSTSTII